MWWGLFSYFACSYHLLEARRVAPKQRPNPLVPEHCVPVDELERDLYRYECIINGRKQQCISSRHLRDVVFDAEDLDLQRTWDGVDMLHVALSEVKGQVIDYAQNARWVATAHNTKQLGNVAQRRKQ